MSSQRAGASRKSRGGCQSIALWSLVSGFVIGLFAGTAWAEGLHKFSSLTVTNDPRTSNWTATCVISITGVDADKIYSGVMRVQYLPWEGEAAIPVFKALFQVDPENRTWTESLTGEYRITAKLEGPDVSVRAEFKFNTPISGDRISCGARIDQGPLSAAIALFGSNMVNTVALP